MTARRLALGALVLSAVCCASATFFRDVPYTVDVERLADGRVVVSPREWLPGKDGPANRPKLSRGAADSLVRQIIRESFGGVPVVVTGTPNDGYVLTYDSLTGTWLAAESAGGALTPWTENVSAAGYSLLNAAAISGADLAFETTDDMSFSSTDLVDVSGTTVSIAGTTAVTLTGAGAASIAVESSNVQSRVNGDLIIHGDVSGVQSITGGGFTQGFMPGDGVHPTSNPAALTVYASTLHGAYAFDQTTAESIIYEGVMDHHYDSARDLSVTLYVCSTATSGNPVVFTAEIEYVDDGTLDLDADSFATAETSASTNTSATAGICVPVTFSLSNAEADSIVAGAPYRLRIARVPGDAGDTLAADALVLRVVVAQ